MKSKSLKSVLLMVLLIGFSCDEPETIVTNIVHPDGSVTRRIEMRNSQNKFEISALQVPFDSTWIVKDTIELGKKGDTTWVKKAEKLFSCIEDINMSYLNDKGANKELAREAKFSKKFRWFNTVYRFGESIDKKMSGGYPVREFLNQEELTWFYSPGSINNDKLKSADSIKYKAFSDTVNTKVELWTTKSLASEWIGVFTGLTEGKGGKDLTRESLKAREDIYVKLIKDNDQKFDSLWEKGVILREFIGEDNAVKFRTEADSALAVVMNHLFMNFKEYSVRIVMPGKVIGTNGFIDKTEMLLWPVKSDYFLTEPYEMWAESKVINTWTWVVTGAFILFVIAGLVIRLFQK
jgi:hypothetical protein